MRLMVVFAIMTMAGCSSVSGKEESLAQCQLDVLGSKGATFRRNYAEGEFVPSGKDGSYREFMLTCMEAKGYQFDEEIYREDGKLGRCWIEDEKGLLPDSLVDEPSCYSRTWW